MANWILNQQVLALDQSDLIYDLCNCTGMHLNDNIIMDPLIYACATYKQDDVEQELSANCELSFLK